MKKTLSCLLCALMLATALFSCGAAPNAAYVELAAGQEFNTENFVAKFSERDLDTEYLSGDTRVTLSDDGSSATDDSVKIDGGIITFTTGGTYVISGTLSDGRLVVNAADTDNVHLIFNSIKLTSKINTPFLVMNANKVVVTLPDETNSVLTDAAEYSYSDIADSGVNACMYSHDDLTINGLGGLTIKGNYANGINCRDDFKNANSSLTISAVKNGIHGKDSVVIGGGTITIKAGKDAMKSSELLDAAKGFVYILGGVIDISASDDAIQAEKAVIVAGGKINLRKCDQTINCPGVVSTADGVFTK